MLREYSILGSNGDFVLNAQTIAAIMSVGNSIFVNEATGSDTTGDGSSAHPFATLDAAIAAATVSTRAGCECR